jgi:hypothetical protein
MAGRVDEARELTNGTQTNGALADGKAVWFWHPLLVLNSRRRVSPTGLRQTFNPRMTVTRRIRRRGEHGISRKTIARGMPGDFRCDRGDYARVLCFISHARLRVHRAPGIPCALIFLGERFLQKLGRIAPRECGVVFEIGRPSLRAKRSNPSRRVKEEWIASSLCSSQ